MDSDLCTLTLLLPCFSPSSACPQTDSDQLYNTQQILRALTSGWKQALSQVITLASSHETSAVILSSLYFIPGSGAGSLKPQIYEEVL